MKTLRKGDKGEEVKLLQSKLNITSDSIFGDDTESAVMSLQREHNLVVDGIVGDKTWAALGVKEETNSKCVDPSVIYAPLNCCVSKSPNRTIKYLAIHYTAGGSSAPGRAKGMKSSWEKSFNPDPKNYYCWAVGDKKAAGVKCTDGRNSNTISIEICSNLKKGTSASKPNHSGWYYTDEALNNGIRLAKILMKKFNITVERVVRHYDISGKLCPGIIGYNDGRIYNEDGTKTDKFNNSDKWREFKSRLTTH